MKKQYKMWIAATSMAGILYLFLDAIILEKYFFEIKVFAIGNKKRGNKLKLLLLSDLHFKNRMSFYYYHLAKKINQLEPDLILISGDMLDRTGKTGPMDKFLNALHHDFPKVAIPGNHDHKADADLSLIKNIYEKHNCIFLVNQSCTIQVKGHRLAVTGLDDFIEGKSRFKDAVKDIEKEEHHLLLLHSPLQQEQVKREISEINKQRHPDKQLNIRYIFAGHNHGGQVKLPGYVPVLPAKSGNYVKGWYNSEEPCLYVSKGFGTTTVPFRFGARAEITVFNYYL